MNKYSLTAVFFAAALGVSACSTDPQINAAVGGLTGAAVGSQIGKGSGRTTAILGGAAVGAAVGGSQVVNP